MSYVGRHPSGLLTAIIPKRLGLLAVTYLLGLMNLQAEPDFIDHGVVAPVSSSRGAAATVGAGDRPVVLVWSSSSGLPSADSNRLNLLVVDVEDGSSEVVALPEGIRFGQVPFANLLSSQGRWISLFGGNLLEFDPQAMEWSHFQPGFGKTASSFTEGADGKIYAALFGDSIDLVVFDPETREATHHRDLISRNWRQWPGRLAVDDGGWVYLGIGFTRQSIAAFHPETREVRELLTGPEGQSGTAPIVYRAADGAVYGRIPPGGDWYRFENGEMEVFDEDPPRAVRVDADSWQTPLGRLPDGRELAGINLARGSLELRGTEASGERDSVEFSYESGGALVLSVGEGPDGRVYGSTGHPLRFYVFDPDDGTFEHWGLRAANGHVNAVTHQGGKIYGGIYGPAALIEFDPEQPWDESWEKPGQTNPRKLHDPAPNIHRPHDLLAHPDGRHVILAGTPAYGQTGGGLLIYDRETGTLTELSHEDILEHQSTKALKALPDGNLVGGGTTRAGTSGEVQASEAELYLMDWPSHKVTHRSVPVPGAYEIWDVTVSAEGLVYGIAVRDLSSRSSIFFVFDPEKKEVIHRKDFSKYGPVAGGQASRVFFWTDRESEGNPELWVMFRNFLLRIDPKNFEVTRVVHPPVDMEAGLAVLDGRLYFASGARLWSYGLSDD